MEAAWPESISVQQAYLSGPEALSAMNSKASTKRSLRSVSEVLVSTLVVSFDRRPASSHELAPTSLPKGATRRSTARSYVAFLFLFLSEVVIGNGTHDHVPFPLRGSRKERRNQKRVGVVGDSEFLAKRSLVRK